jgi:hypothetical protein
MLLDASGTPLPQTAPPVQAPPVHPFAHLAQFANPTLANELRGIADLVEQGIVFDVTLVALGKDLAKPEPITLGRHTFADHLPLVIGELSVLQTRIGADLIRLRTPRPTLANGEVVEGGAA